MKYIKTFEQYINESVVNEGKDYTDYGLSDEFSSALDDLDDKKFNTKDITTLAKKYKQDPKKAIEYASNAFEWLWNESVVYEKRITPPRNGFKLKDIENILKKSGDLELVADGSHYYINSYMHDNGRLDDATNKSLFAIDQDAEEFEIRLKDIEFIEAF
jgi:hypothetical protein